MWARKGTFARVESEKCLHKLNASNGDRWTLEFHLIATHALGYKESHRLYPHPGGWEKIAPSYFFARPTTLRGVRAECEGVFLSENEWTRERQLEFGFRDAIRAHVWVFFIVAAHLCTLFFIYSFNSLVWLIPLLTSITYDVFESFTVILFWGLVICDVFISDICFEMLLCSDIINKIETIIF